MPATAAAMVGQAAALLAAALLPSAAVAAHATGSGEVLPGHSFVAPLDLAKIVSDFWLAGTAIPSPHGVMLSPGTPNRQGMVWTQYPLLTDNYEVEVKLRGASPPATGKTVLDGAGFAFWVVYENVTQAQQAIAADKIENQEQMLADTWQKAVSDSDFDLFGYRSKFNGLGVFLLPGSADGKEGPSVSAVRNGGDRRITRGSGLPASDAIKHDFLDGGVFTLKVRIEAAKATISIGDKTVVVAGENKPLAYIGMTGLGGKLPGTALGAKSPLLEITEMTVRNHASGGKGEEEHQVDRQPVKPMDEKVDVLAQTSAHKDHRAESDAIKDLTNMVFKLVVESGPLRQQMSKSLESLGRRIDFMETSFNDLKDELDRKTGHKLGVEFAAIKDELASLATTASKNTQQSNSRLEKLHADIADVHRSAAAGPENLDRHLDDLSNHNSKVLDQLNNEHQRMFGISVGAIALIVIGGLALYNKFRQWEKKHVL